MIIIASSLWARYKIKKVMCERSHWHNPPSSLFAYIRILIDPPHPLSTNIIIEYPLRLLLLIELPIDHDFDDLDDLLV